MSIQTKKGSTEAKLSIPDDALSTAPTTTLPASLKDSQNLSAAAANTPGPKRRGKSVAGPGAITTSSSTLAQLCDSRKYEVMQDTEMRKQKLQFEERKWQHELEEAKRAAEKNEQREQTAKKNALYMKLLEQGKSLSEIKAHLEFAQENGLL